LAPKKVFIFQEENFRRLGGYYLWFERRKNSWFTRVLINITKTNNETITLEDDQIEGKRFKI